MMTDQPEFEDENVRRDYRYIRGWAKGFAVQLAGRVQAGDIDDTAVPHVLRAFMESLFLPSDTAGSSISESFYLEAYRAYINAMQVWHSMSHRGSGA